MLACPSCKNTGLGWVASSQAGDYCTKCGLVLHTYYALKSKVRKLPVKSEKSVHCVGCGKDKNITNHHLIPKRTGLPTKLIPLCRTPCHNIADKLADALYPEIKIVSKTREGNK